MTSPDPTPLSPEPLTATPATALTAETLIDVLARIYEERDFFHGDAQRVRAAAVVDSMDFVRVISAARSPADPSPEPLREALTELKGDSDFAYWVQAHASGSRALALLERFAATPTAGAGGLDVEPIWEMTKRRTRRHPRLGQRREPVSGA